MTCLGQIDEGLHKLDDAISRLDGPGSIDRMDAFIVGVKRKINALNDLRRYEEVIPLAQRNRLFLRWFMGAEQSKHYVIKTAVVENEGMEKRSWGRFL